MGLLRDIGNTVTRAVRNPGRTVGNIARDVGRNRAFQAIMPGAAIQAGIAGNLLGGKSEPEIAAPGMDRGLRRIRRDQAKQAREFEAGIPKMADDLFGGVEKQERRRLANQMSGIRNDASSRGLLYSGIREDQEQRARAESSGSLASARADINSQLQDQSRDMKANAVKTGLNIQQAQQQIHDQIYNQALANMASKRGLISGFAGAAGTAVGSMSGGR